MEKIYWKDLGRMRYKSCWDFQEEVFAKAVNLKVSNRNKSEREQKHPVHHFYLVEHPPVYTLGKSGSLDNILISDEERSQKSIDFHKINRGGDITFHGPEQIVGYPILDLDCFFTDIHKYLRLLEEMIIKTLEEYDIKAGRLEGATGVWLDPEDVSKARKICAMGIKCSRWVTMHGFAFNVNTDLRYFDHIIPCGIDDKAVTSMEKELGRKISVEEVKSKLLKHFAQLFEATLVPLKNEMYQESA